MNFSGDSSIVVAGDLSGKVRGFQVDNRQLIFSTDQLADSYVSALLPSPIGDRFVVGFGDGTVKILSLTSGAPLLTLSGHTDRINSIAIDKEGRRISTSSKDGTTRTWDLNTGLLLTTITHGASANWASYSADGTKLATASSDNSADIWRAFPVMQDIVDEARRLCSNKCTQ